MASLMASHCREVRTMCMSSQLQDPMAEGMLRGGSKCWEGSPRHAGRSQVACRTCQGISNRHVGWSGTYHKDAFLSGISRISRHSPLDNEAVKCYDAAHLAKHQQSRLSLRQAVRQCYGADQDAWQHRTRSPLRRVSLLFGSLCFHFKRAEGSDASHAPGCLPPSPSPAVAETDLPSTARPASYSSNSRRDEAALSADCLLRVMRGFAGAPGSWSISTVIFLRDLGDPSSSSSRAGSGCSVRSALLCSLTMPGCWLSGALRLALVPGSAERSGVASGSIAP
mmetsp:Transcript_11532/g.35620  ORF Transcript_11532/g.35620 Transcript_11532/m.35620 type:complete len:281 (-) Transcript_11532:53-895(-)|eukprot:scaffold15517_cov27-Tisochrysis_lutea.AAC.3